MTGDVTPNARLDFLVIITALFLLPKFRRPKRRSFCPPFQLGYDEEKRTPANGVQEVKVFDRDYSSRVPRQSGKREQPKKVDLPDLRNTILPPHTGHKDSIASID